ncbi:hypothetical protein Tco_0044651, partial [Tanacetum coccineum]
VTDIHKRTKTKPKRTKTSTGLEEREKTKPMMFFIFNGPTRTRFIGRVKIHALPHESPLLEDQRGTSDITASHVGNPKQFYWLRNVEDALKEDHVLNKKVIEATEAYTKNFTHLTELLTLIKNFDFQGLKSSVESLRATALSQDKHLADWANVPQTTLAITGGLANVVGENVTPTVTEEPPSHTKGEIEDTKKEQVPKEPKHVVPISIVKPIETQPITTIITSQSETSQAPKRIDKGKKIATDDVESPVKLVPASRVVREDPNEPELIKKAAKQARLLAITKPGVVKVVRKEAEKIGINTERITSAKEGEKFKKAQDVELNVLNKERNEKLRKSLELRKHKYENNMWTIGNRLKPEEITYVNIHPHTKHVVVTVYRRTDRRTFEFHNPFYFGAYGITELVELREIIPKKKNVVVKDMMNSLSRRYKRIKKIPGELRIQSALLAPILKQASSKPSGRKRKHMELEPKIKVTGLECNRSLLEGVPFVNNMVIEEPEYGIFFTDVFGDQAFQRWNDIHQVGVDSMVSYLVMASMIKTPENARFCLKLKKLIAKHPDQKKLKSKKVKLEALGYKLD